MDSARLVFAKIHGKVWVSPEEFPEDAQCTARTKRGKRCANFLDFGQVDGRHAYLKVDGGYVEGWNYDQNNGWPTERGRRYLEQRCELHFGSDAPAHVEPEWEPFDPSTHAAQILSAERIADSISM